MTWLRPAFKTNPVSLEELLKDCGSGRLQLPDFQRSWVWDENRIKSSHFFNIRGISHWGADDT